MKKILNYFFVGLGIIFFILIIAGTYFFITDPYNLKPLIFGTSKTMVVPNKVTPTPEPESSEVTTPTSQAETVVAGGFELSEAQKQALVSFGIDPATVPSSISVEQESCFVGVLGAARVEEIKAGAVPNALELLKAKACI